MRVSRLSLALALLFMVLSGTSAVAERHAVALLYHHVSTDTPGVTSVSPGRFREHVDYLSDNGFTVRPLGDVAERLRKGEDVPEKTVAITFDDAYRSVYTEAFPLLRRREWPFTVFVNTAAVDAGYDPYMTWDQLRELAAYGAEIGNHSDSHDHLVRRGEDESIAAWRERVTRDIQQAAQRLTAEIPEAKSPGKLFAYPYGEYSPELKELVSELGYTGIAQQSGVVGPHSDFLALPRFPMATGFADEKRFALAVHARPLRVVKAGETPLKTGQGGLREVLLTLGEEAPAAGVTCYSAQGDRLPLERRGERSLAVDVSGVNSPGRNKINCTAPVSGRQGAWLWYSHQWLVRNRDGSWYSE